MYYKYVSARVYAKHNELDSVLEHGLLPECVRAADYLYVYLAGFVYHACVVHLNI